MVGWHHLFNRFELEQTFVDDGQGSLECFHGVAESGMTQRLNNRSSGYCLVSHELLGICFSFRASPSVAQCPTAMSWVHDRALQEKNSNFRFRPVSTVSNCVALDKVFQSHSFIQYIFNNGFLSSSHCSRFKEQSSEHRR